MATRSCAVCKSTTHLRRCNGCKQVLYCGVECQQRDWKSGHKKKCKSMKIEKNKNDNFNASNDIVMDLRDSIKNLFDKNDKNETFNTNKVQEFWIKHYQKISKNVIKKFQFEKKNEKKKYLNALNELLSNVLFSYLKKSRSIINGYGMNGCREILKLEFWCSINLRSIQTNYINKCPHLHLYFQDRNYHITINPNIYINIKSSDIYNVLSEKFNLIQDIILLIIEYLPYDEDNYCLLHKSSKTGKFKFKQYEESPIDTSLDEYIGVNDNIIITLLLNSIKSIFVLDHSL